MPFGDVISNRKSVRQFHAVSLAQLSELLWYTAKVKSFHLQENGYILTHRGTPSAGARHPIDIIVYQPNLLGSEYFYYYNPFNHSLNPLLGSEKLSAGLVPHIDLIVPLQQGMLIWFVAHQERTSAKYENAASLVWRDSGALINSIQLTCTAMCLNCCPSGSLGEPYISNFFSSPNIVGAGGIIIG